VDVAETVEGTPAREDEPRRAEDICVTCPAFP
jgi:hypothetical protein